MFMRRKKREWWQQTGEYFWPRSGWHRSSRYLFHRLARLPGSSYSIAAGFACGAAISFTPFIGLHFVLSAALAWIVRGNIITSAIGTVVGNPWTFPFIWIWIYKLGGWMTLDPVGREANQMDFAAFFSDMTHAFLDGDWVHLIEKVLPVFWPMFVGSLPTAAVAWFAFYFALKPMIHAYQVRRLMRMQQNRLRKISGENELSGN